MRTIIGIQARSGSTRLHHKSLQTIGNKSIIRHCYDTCKSVGDTVVLCHAADEYMVQYCEYNGLDYIDVDCPENDVLSRYMALATGDYDRIVRITGDCPFPFVVMLDWMIRNSGPVDLMTNVWEPRVFPDGWDCEVMSVPLLEWLDEHATPEEREHVTQHVYRNERAFLSGGGSIAQVRYPLDLSKLKVCVDTQEDLEAVRGMYRE